MDGGVCEGRTRHSSLASMQSRKRQFDSTCEVDPLPTKRARLTLTAAQRPGAEGEETEQPTKTILHQPRPTTHKRQYASFLRNFVNPVHPDPCSESVNTFVSEWLESIGSDREKHCRSDSHLRHSGYNPISRELTKSAPEMSSIRDADGFAVPPTPASTKSHSCPVGADTGSVAPSDLTSATPGSCRSSTKSLVEDPLYRDANLAENKVYMRNPDEEFPECIASLVRDVGKDRSSPCPSPAKLRHDANLFALENGAGEPDVEDYFKDKIFPKSGSPGILKRTDRQPMAKHTVPSTGSKLRVSNPVPDMLYGYNRHEAFTKAQQAQFNSMGNTMVANTQNLIYPFFVIEFKGDDGKMWVATNQCLGGSASCVNVAERLNHQLRECKSDEVRPINTAAFSVSMNGTEARLYISWKHNELDYYMRKVESFLLQRPDHYLEFRKYVRNIIDWGKDNRLEKIRDSLDRLLEESRKRTSETAKSRPSPSDGSGTGGSKKHKSSTSCGRSNGSKNGQQSQNSGTSDPYWEWDETIGRWFHRNTDGTLSWAEGEGRPSSAASQHQ